MKTGRADCRFEILRQVSISHSENIRRSLFQVNMQNHLLFVRKHSQAECHENDQVPELMGMIKTAVESATDWAEHFTSP